MSTPQNKTPIAGRSTGVMGESSLTMSYFHTGIRTIIGAEAFHGPVRDGKEWDHLAMVIRHNRRPLHFPAAGPIRRVDRFRGNQILDRVLRFEERQIRSLTLTIMSSKL